MATDSAHQNLADTVGQLVHDHFPVALAEAVLYLDSDDFDTLVDTCSRISGGDAASISMVFRDVSARYDDQAELSAILDGDEAPAVALAAAVRAHHDSLRQR